jgi:TRAP-type C4-dicarboxylate transport system permease small subunit
MFFSRLVVVEKKLCLAGMIISGALLLGLVILAACNMVCRLLDMPISASYELSGFAGALMAALALAETQRQRGHVELDFFTRSYSLRVRRWVGAFNVFAGAILMFLLAYQLSFRAASLLRAGEVSETLKLPYPWLMYGVVLGLLLLGLSFLTDFILLLAGKDKNSTKMNEVCDEPVQEQNGSVTIDD